MCCWQSPGPSEIPGSLSICIQLRPKMLLRITVASHNDQLLVDCEPRLPWCGYAKNDWKAACHGAFTDRSSSMMAV